MPDHIPFVRIDVLDPRQMGKFLIQWTLEPDSRPTTFAAFKEQVHGTLSIPDNFKGLQFVQSNQDVLFIRLPDAGCIQESLDKLGTKTGDYPLPDFYAEHLTQGQHRELRTMLEFRMSDYMLGDYSMSQCG